MSKRKTTSEGGIANPDPHEQLKALRSDQKELMAKIDDRNEALKELKAELEQANGAIRMTINELDQPALPFIPSEESA